MQNRESTNCNFDKNNIMRDDSNTFMYVVGGIILLHFIVGFVWLIFKFSKKKDDK
jgi:flagellar biogenesis protein FliO